MNKTVDMMTKEEVKEAYQAWAEGWDMGRLAARYGVAPAELNERMMEIQRAKERRRAAEGAGGTLGSLNAALFAELDRLGEVDRTDADAIAAEVERSRAIEGIADTIIKNASTVLAAKKMVADYTKRTFDAPKMLEG